MKLADKMTFVSPVAVLNELLKRRGLPGVEALTNKK